LKPKVTTQPIAGTGHLKNFGAAKTATLIVVTLFLVNLAVTASGNQTKSLLSQAEALFNQRYDMEKARQAAQLYRRVLDLEPEHEQAACRLVRTLAWMGFFLNNDEKEKVLYQEAAKVAEQAAKCHPNQPQTIYWLGVAQGLLANVSGILGSLTLVDSSQKNMRRLIELDPAFQFGGGYRILGRIHTKLPGLLGGDKDQAEDYLRKAVQMGPKFWQNHLYLAALLKDQGRAKEARRVLGDVLQGGPLPGFEPEFKVWRQEALKMLN
jgi:tetratricopeptide (TPR) repeat protein